MDLPSPPFVIIPGIINVRDIGGYAVSNKPSQYSVRRGLVYRAGDPSRVENDGLEKLKELGIKKIFDLRSMPEIKREGPEWKGVEVGPGAFKTRSDGQTVSDGDIERIWAPVFSEEDYTPEKIAIRFQEYARSGSEGFVMAYKAILENAPSAYKTILSHIAEPSPEPCIYHCTAGKDRTGVLTAIIYLLCGVDEEVIAKEYQLTDKGLEGQKSLFRERLRQHPAFENNKEGVDNMIMSRAENMRQTIDMIGEVYGTAERYVTEVVGLSEQQVTQLKKNLVAEKRAVL